MWLDGQGGRAVELFYFPFLCAFQTQSTTPLSQLKLSISQRPTGESWLLAKAAQVLELEVEVPVSILGPERDRSREMDRLQGTVFGKLGSVG